MALRGSGTKRRSRCSRIAESDPHVAACGGAEHETDRRIPDRSRDDEAVAGFALFSGPSCRAERCLNAEIEIVTGPGVRSVSPPNSGQPTCSAVAPSAAANPRASGRRSPWAAQSTGEAQCGLWRRDPERLTRSAFLATASGGSSGKKWTPPMIALVLSTRSWPDGTPTTAASSIRPSPGCVASGPKYRAISWSSPDPPSLPVRSVPSRRGSSCPGPRRCPRPSTSPSIAELALGGLEVQYASPYPPVGPTAELAIMNGDQCQSDSGAHLSAAWISVRPVAAAGSPHVGT